MAILTVHQSIKSMAQVMDVAEEIKTKRRKQMILMFLSAVLIFIPIGDQAIGAIAGLAAVGRFLTLASEAALVGPDLYSIVDDLASAPFVIFGYILQAGALADAVKVNKAAQARRSLRNEDIDKFGAVFARGMTKIDNVMKACRG
jgi:hypothetical protein